MYLMTENDIGIARSALLYTSGVLPWGGLWQTVWVMEEEISNLLASVSRSGSNVVANEQAPSTVRTFNGC